MGERKRRLTDKIEALRRSINKPRRKAQLMLNTAHWFQICSALDVLEDTEEALSAWKKIATTDPGTNYLLTYGVLQTLTLQRDAALNLEKALDLAKRAGEDAALTESNEVRIKTAGHPTRRDRIKGGGLTYHGITRITLSTIAFTLNSYKIEGDNVVPVSEHIDLSAIVKRHRKAINRLLDSMISELASQDDAYRKRRAETKLANAIVGHDYLTQQLVTTDSSGALAALQSLSKMLDDFDHGLEQLEILERAYANLDLVRNELRPCLSRLSAYYEGENDSVLDADSSYVYGRFVVDRFDELSVMASEIDNE